jgi:hypothetical protein
LSEFISKLHEYEAELVISGETLDQSILQDIEAEFDRLVSILSDRVKNRPTVSVDNGIKYCKAIRRLRRLISEFA